MPPPLTPLILLSARMLPRILAACGEGVFWRGNNTYLELKRTEYFFYLDIVYGALRVVRTRNFLLWRVAFEQGACKLNLQKSKTAKITLVVRRTLDSLL